MFHCSACENLYETLSHNKSGLGFFVIVVLLPFGIDEDGNNVIISIVF